MRMCCFVPGCKTSYKSSKRNKERGIKNKSLFKAPTNPDLKSEWDSMIPRSDRCLGPEDVVCELHFREEDILRYYETKMPDGSLFKLERGKRHLKEGAVPCIFPGFPGLLINLKSECISFSEELKSEASNFDVEENHNDHFTVYSEHDDDKSLVGIDDIDFFDNLKQQINEITLPNSYWSGSFITAMNVVIFTEWSKEYTVGKRVIVKPDSSFQVIIGNSEINDHMISKQTITCFEDIASLLEYVNRLIMCKGVKVMSAIDSCAGIVSTKVGQKGISSHKCPACLTAHKQITIVRQTKLYSNQQDKLKRLVKSAKRK